MIIPMLCVTIFVILVVWFLLPRVARLMIHTPTAISIFVCLSMVQLMAVWFCRPRVARLLIHSPLVFSIFLCLGLLRLLPVFISLRCPLCEHFLRLALTLILVVGYAIAAG